MRRFYHVYNKDERELFAWHFETIVHRKSDEILSTRFHIGNTGSETPWDGHFLLFGIGFFWGFTGLRGLADFVTRCKGYKYDYRDWSLRISDKTLWWDFACHSDMCEAGRGPNPKRGKPYRRRTWRHGNLNLSIAEAIWGPKRYTYEEIDKFDTTIKMPEGEYPATLTLQKSYLGRKRVPQRKHIQSFVIDVDVPKGVPSHYDKSGGWKGDRTYGFGVNFFYPKAQGWQQDAENAVAAWVLKERARTGFREPQEVDAG